MSKARNIADSNLGDLTVDTNTLVIDSTNNRVGIGTSSPSSELHIASDSPILTLQDTNSTEPLATYISFKDSGGNEHGWIGYGSASTDIIQIANAYDDISFYTGTGGTSAERMRIDSSGNVGIGTSSPAEKLAVNGNIDFPSASSTIGYDGSSGGTNRIAQIEFYNGSDGSMRLSTDNSSSGGINFYTEGSERMRIARGGNVGIGTNSPSGVIHAYKNSGSPTILGRFENPSGEALVEIKSQNDTLGILQFADSEDSNVGAVQYSHSENSMRFKTSDSEAMRIDSSGNVGIGTSSPSSAAGFDAKLQLESANPMLVYKETDQSTKWEVGAWGGNYVVFNGSSERMRIDSSGNVGIGTAGRSASGYTILGVDNATNGGVIEVLQNGTIKGQLFYDGTQTRLRSNLSTDLVLDTNDTERMRIDSSGNVGIGTSSPAALLDIKLNTNSTADIFKFQRLDGAVAGVLNYSGTDGAISFGTTTSHDLTFDTANTERLRIDSSGNVGIGTSSPSSYYSDRLVVSGGTGEDGITIACSNTIGENYLMFADGTTGNEAYRGFIGYNHSSDSIRLASAGSERMRIDSSGNLLVGKTSDAFGTAGCEARPEGSLRITRDNSTAGFFNRLNSDGTIIALYRDSTQRGLIGISAARPYIGSSSSTAHSSLKFTDAGGEGIIHPCTYTGAVADNSVDLGYSSARFDNIYATNGTIQTSDQNEKQDIEALSEAEQRVAVAAKGLLRKFRWIDSVEEKGDDARIHFGIIAQDLQAAFEAEGLDAGRYAMFINSTWTDEETGEERSRMGVRYNQLLAFIIAAI